VLELQPATADFQAVIAGVDQIEAHPGGNVRQSAAANDDGAHRGQARQFAEDVSGFCGELGGVRVRYDGRESAIKIQEQKDALRVSDGGRNFPEVSA
jgi:hypothetical protein